MVELYCEKHGSGSPLLLLAGLAADISHWAMQIETLSAHHLVIVCDNRGAGRSPAPPGAYDVASMARDTVALLDRLDLPRVHLLGHSMGGAIAQQIALDFPERVDRLILAASFARLPARSLAVTEGWSLNWASAASPQQFARVLLPWVYSPEFFEDSQNLELAVAAIGQAPYPIQPAALAAQVEALRGFDSRPHLQKIAAPTLVLAAQHDLLAPPEVAGQLAQGIPLARLQMLDCAHSCMFELPTQFNQAVLDFLAETN